MSWNSIYTIAESEIIIGVRNKWTHIFTIIFTILVLGISYFGLTASGYTGSMQDFSRTTLSLLNLVLYIIPLISLIIGVMSFSGDGRLNELIFAQPLNRWEIYLGKLLGLLVVIFTSTSLGFGISGFIILMRVGSDGVFRYLVFVLLSLYCFSQVVFQSFCPCASEIVRIKIKLVKIKVAFFIFPSSGFV